MRRAIRDIFKSWCMKEKLIIDPNSENELINSLVELFNLEVIRQND